MSAHLGKILLMVAMSHGLRILGRRSKPQWTGLALGLPCTTAVALVGGGLDRGVDYAVVMSGTSLVGLTGAVMLPVAFARALGRGWRLPWAILAAVATYLVIALASGRILPTDGTPRLGLAAMMVLLAIWMVGRISVGQATRGKAQVNLSKLKTQAFRAAVPVACLLGSLLVGDAFGPELAGLMSSFPGITLTILLMSHLESGPAAAIRMARALPAGNLGMVAFLATFRSGCLGLGLTGGTVVGYLAALTMLAIVVKFDDLKASARRLRDDLAAVPKPAGPPPWPRAGRRFSPWVERLAA